MGHPLEHFGSVLFETARDALFLFDTAQDRLLDANPSALALCALDKSQLAGVRPRDLFRMDDGASLTDGFLGAAAASSGPVQRRLRLRGRSEGAWNPVQATIVALPAAAQALVAVADDLSQPEAEVLLRALIDSIPDLIFYKDRLGVFRGCNAAYEKFIGRKEQDLIGTTELDLFPREVGERHLGRDRKVLSGGTPLRSEEWLHYPDGHRVLVEEVKTPLVGRDGQLLGLLGIGRDITERRHLEEQLRHAQKLEAVGQLAGGVAHDFNNLLTVMLGNLALLLNGAPEPQTARELLEAADKAGWRAAELVRHLLSFSRQTMLHPQPTNLAAVVDEVIAIIRRAFDPRIVLHFERPTDLWQVPVDPNQMHQVLMNLCLNARDAMCAGGQLTFTAANVKLDEDFTKCHPDAWPGEFVRLSVSDTGAGIAPEVLPRVFEPFFTTKGVGQGTGLGLSIVFGILKQHDGWIECTSEVGAGTCFDLYLPRLAEGRGVSTFQSPQALPWGGTETILVVDDEAMIREQCGLILRHRGYRVLLAADGQEAERIYARAAPRVELVLLDCVMPRRSGRETFHRLQALDSNVRVLFSSGYAAEHVIDEFHAPGVLGFVAKPYRPDELARAVRGALDEGRIQPASPDSGPP